MSMVKEWQHLKISFHEIEVATENFKTFIGRGGYGSVFKGKLLVAGKETMVAIKRLNEQSGQGLKEFLTEIQLLAAQQHPNLISLVGYCDEGKEKTIVYEYAERGSLDQYTRRTKKTTSTTLTWLQRLKICTDAARGLSYLHSNVGGHRTIIHRDIKSSNILIDENWVGKISDLGLSKLSMTDLVVTNGCGTPGYCEPEYFHTQIVTKKSDVYSFGVVLFEVLCGRLCLSDTDDGFSLSSKSAIYHYKMNSLDKIIDDSLREHVGSQSMTKVLEIAYACLHDDREQRPAMDVVLKELEEALKYHEEYEFQNVKMSKSPVVEEDDKNSRSIAAVKDDKSPVVEEDDTNSRSIAAVKGDKSPLFRRAKIKDDKSPVVAEDDKKSRSIAALKDEKKSKSRVVVEDDTDDWGLNNIFQEEYEFQNGKKSESPAMDVVVKEFKGVRRIGRHSGRR
ncbi:serine-threonine/tyrosine-protein kinase catalytic domain-containing protein [Artemisia annua]|uniref:Serine-threonine/tyrosine-protein kinase catalytic domain-containing protein n=1 Tax=Artemisia annua TaxID=35608 RepID=A0A2U1KH35_ARTAN|nr:serine-threonine/tyrosine-protein kinase catalytic domain-containing protein [Artemisia annua]